MSVQFGIWDLAHKPRDQNHLNLINVAIAPYGPDSKREYVDADASILYRAFHTTKESREEIQPYVSFSGSVLTWDGRLDNRDELLKNVGVALSADTPDVQIVASAYSTWGVGCFAKLIGDWALSIWSPQQCSLLLAKDPIGTRHLYYAVQTDRIIWSSVLDALVLSYGAALAISEEYLAGWLSMFPATHLTPFGGVHAVPPSSFVTIGPSQIKVAKYWEFDPTKKIRFRDDRDYEHQFRRVFAEAVLRRLRSDRPIVAELSGGIDSSAIVCMADELIRNGSAETPGLETISWYYDFDPALDERPYFSEVEKRRGRKGCHINAGLIDVAASEAGFHRATFSATPNTNRSTIQRLKEYSAFMQAHGSRVVLSGLGGEEATGGGVPTPVPELQDLLMSGRFLSLILSLRSWAKKMRKPCLSLLRDALEGFISRQYPRGTRRIDNQWLSPSFARRHRDALASCSLRVTPFGASPSFQHHMRMLEIVRRFLACSVQDATTVREMAYPYLDRELLEFAFAIPIEQMVRVGERRSLMKRALADIVPPEILTRRKLRPHSNLGPTHIPEALPHASSMPHNVDGFDQVININFLLRVLQEAKEGKSVPLYNLRRVLALHNWLRDLMDAGILVRSLRTPGKRNLDLRKRFRTSRT